MKFDKAYCVELDQKLSIFEVRDLHFDESQSFQSDACTFLCPDDACREQMGELCKLTTVNASKLRYIKTPHFKDIQSTQHSAECPYHSEVKPADETDHVSLESDKSSAHQDVEEKHFHYPIEFLPQRKEYFRQEPELDTKPPEVFRLESKVLPMALASNNTPKAAANRTSIFEHIVDGFIAHMGDKDSLKAMPLTIGDTKLSYWSYFKKIRFFQDREGLIYWGKIKAIRDYKYSFSIVFQDRVDGQVVSLYIKKKVIDEYRKSQAFRQNIRDASQHLEGSRVEGSREDVTYGFFYGVYPKHKAVKKDDKTFNVYNVEIDHLDHFLIKHIDEDLFMSTAQA